MIRSSVQVRLSALERPHKGRSFIFTLLCALLPLAPLAPLAAAPRAAPRVAIDPGHGGRNHGAADPRRKGWSEKRYTLMIAERVRALLERAGVEVFMTRRKDEPHTLQERMRAASAAGVDAFVSVHINDHPLVGARGHGTFFLAREVFDASRERLHEFDEQTRGRVFESNVTLDPAQPPPSGAARAALLDLLHQAGQHEAVHLAHLVNQALSARSPFGTRGVKQADFGVIKGVAMPAIVCEVGFINHPKEGPFVTSEEGMDALAKGISEGVIRYLALRRGALLELPDDGQPAPAPPAREE